MKRTKKQALRDKKAWNQAIADGRVVKYPALGSFTSYPTKEVTERALSEAKSQGIDAHVVDPKLAQLD